MSFRRASVFVRQSCLSPLCSVSASSVACPLIPIPLLTSEPTFKKTALISSYNRIGQISCNKDNKTVTTLYSLYLVFKQNCYFSLIQSSNIKVEMYTHHLMLIVS